MDIFNKKKVKRLEENLKLLSEKEARARGIIKYLIEEPNSNIAKELNRILYEKYSKSIWSGLTRESHLGYVYDKESTERLAKEMTKYL